MLATAFLMLALCIGQITSERSGTLIFELQREVTSLKEKTIELEKAHKAEIKHMQSHLNSMETLIARQMDKLDSTLSELMGDVVALKIEQARLGEEPS